MVTDSLQEAQEQVQEPTTFTSGSGELDNKFGGGIPLGALTLIEGQSSSGKSVICQQITHGALESGLGVAYLTSENTIKTLLTQMASLDMDATDHFLLDIFRIYRLQMSNREINSDVLFGRLADYIEARPKSYKVVIVDSITNIISHGRDIGVMDFFANCKELCADGRTIFLVAHSHGFNDGLLARIRSLCDAHLNLRLEEMGALLVKVMEVTKVLNAERTQGNSMSFDVEAGMGLKTIPITRAKA